MVKWGCGEDSRNALSGTWYVVGLGMSRSVRMGGRWSITSRKQSLGLNAPSTFPTPLPQLDLGRELSGPSSHSSLGVLGVQTGKGSFLVASFCLRPTGSFGTLGGRITSPTVSCDRPHDRTAALDIQDIC